mgnify:CR=1 FL=1
MKQEEFDRLNTLSEKAINNILSPIELNEFKHLVTIWNESIEYNLLQGSCTLNFKE